MNNLENKIKQKLKQVKPKPKWRFVGVAVIKDIALAILLVTIILGAGIIIYIVSHFNPWESLPAEARFFARGFISLPWELIGLFALLFLVIYFLVKKVHFIYRMNNMMVITGILLLIFGGYMIAEATGLNNVISDKPIVKGIYQKQGMFLRGDRGPLVAGEVSEVQNDKYIITDFGGNKWEVLIDKDTKIKPGAKIGVGDVIGVIGKKNKGTIKAYGIKKMDQDFRGHKFDPPKPEVKGGFNFRPGQRFIQ